MPRLFADLHVHPTLYAYNRLYPATGRPRMEGVTPWTEVAVNAQKMAAGAHAAAYSQASFAQMTRGRMRLPFVSVTPIEKSFLDYDDELDKPGLAGELARLLTGITPLGAVRALGRGDRQAALRQALGLLRAKSPLRLMLQKSYLGYGLDRLRYLTSDEHDYWEAFGDEYDFLLKGEGTEHRGVLHRIDDGGRRTVREEVTGAYHLVRSPAELDQVLFGSERDIAVALSIEGGHVLSLDPRGRPLPLATILERVETLKGLDRPLFFLGLAHHFDNGLCGHARSIPDLGGLVISQRRRLGEGFERRDDAGLTVTRALLDLDPQGRDLGGRRVLIDIKHMSPRTRKELYAELLEPHLAWWGGLPRAKQEARPQVPLIASHVAYSGVASLDELIDNAPAEDDYRHVGPYYGWGLNLSDEDVRMIHASQGLCGIILDSRVSGLPKGQKVTADRWSRILLQQIFGLVDVIWQDERIAEAQRSSVWDRLCIGSDYEGCIQPMKPYPTVLEFDGLFDELTGHLQHYRHTRHIEVLGVETLIEKLAWKNAYDFFARHLPLAVG